MHRDRQMPFRQPEICRGFEQRDRRGPPARDGSIVSGYDF